MIQSADTYAQAISVYPLVFFSDRDPIVEDMAFPPMRTVLRAEHERLGRPPRQDEFEAACRDHWGRSFPGSVDRAISARLARAYASLIREEHFGLLLRAACEPEGYHVLDDAELDMAKGIDYAVTGTGRTVGIAVRLATRRAFVFDNRKAWRRHVGWDIVTAELDSHNRVECGRFWLFDGQWVEEFTRQTVLPLAVEATP